MKKFYDCGIDLGTTNSCIAVPNMDNTCTIVENVTDRMQVTPSVVWINQRGRIVIGQRAYTCINVQDVKKEFKRDMGTETVYEFPAAGIKKTPEELSAEILKSLRRDAESRTNREIRDVVVTVPAAFSMVQCEATKKAASLAGFRNIILLQEPIAASIAYGAQPNAKDQYWLVFDYGGGTLDVSVISTVDGRLDNITSVGNNHMGGKDLDRLLYEKVIVPKLGKEYDLNGGLNPLSKAKLMQFVENCKIQLSTQEEVEFEVYDIEDNRGNIMDGLYEIRRSEFDAAIDREIDAAISVAREAIAKSGIKEQQFTKVILVGGSTYVPLVKKKIRESFAIELDCSLNPMTVVAEGAALYSASITVNESEETGASVRSGEFLVELQYEPMTSEERVNIIGKIPNANGQISRIKIDGIANEEAESAIWTSGWVDVIDKDAAIFDIDLQISTLNGRNIFRIAASSEDGSNVPLSGYLFEILHRQTSLKLAAPPMPYAIGILVTDGKDNRIDWLVEKDTKLPVSITESYFLNKALIPGENSVCEIKIYEGDGKKFTYNPDANYLMRVVHIRSNELTRTLELGTKIDITIEIDTSRCVTITGSVPMYDYELVAETLSSSEENYTNYGRRMDEIERKIIQTEQTLQTLHEKGIQVAELESRFRKIKEDFDKYYDLIGIANDQVHHYIEDFYDLQTTIIMKELESRKERRAASNSETLCRIDQNIRTYGNKTQIQQYEELKCRYDNAKGADTKEYMLGKLDRLESDVVFDNFEFLKRIYHANYASSSSYVDLHRANYWKGEARKAISSGNKPLLLQVIEELGALRIRTAGEAVRVNLADLKK